MRRDGTLPPLILYAFVVCSTTTLPFALKCALPAVCSVTALVWVSVTDVRSSNKGASVAVAFVPAGADRRWLECLSFRACCNKFFTGRWSKSLTELLARQGHRQYLRWECGEGKYPTRNRDWGKVTSMQNTEISNVCGCAEVYSTALNRGY